MPEFRAQPPVEIARRLELRGGDSSSWLAVLIPSTNSEIALDGLRADLSSLLQKPTRVLSLEGGTFEQLRADMHQPTDDIVILTTRGDLGQDQWRAFDLMRSALERRGPVILCISADVFFGFSEFAPNIRSFIGPSIFIAASEGSIMTEAEIQTRVQEFTLHYGYGNEELIRRAMSNELPSEPQFVEWLVLIGRGDLV
jgi:hypothetical protein